MSLFACSRATRAFLFRLLAATIACLEAGHVLAQRAPDTLSFQGFVTDPGGTPLNATVPMTFKLYKNGASVWTETQPSVMVTNGVFDVILGSNTTLRPITFDQPIDLGITVGADPEISPRTPLASAPFALGMRGMFARFVDDGTRQSYNVVGGASGNGAPGLVTGVTISGGGGVNQSVSGPNIVSDHFGTIGGGWRNTVSGRFATLAGGSDNQVGGNTATIGGGSQNQTSGVAATIPGGLKNRAAGHSSFAAGYSAKAVHDGAFVWNDRSITTGNDSLVSTAANQFLIRAQGGVGVGTAEPDRELTIFDRDNNGDAVLNLKATNASLRELLIGVNQSTGGLISMQTNNNLQLRTNGTARITIEAGGEVGIANTAPDHPLKVGTDTGNGNGAHVTTTGVWTSASSRMFKEGFSEVDRSELLERLAVLPVTRWRYTGDDPSSHIGPTAEDFRDAFGLGHDERYIATVDADGVALAAIQGLLERLVALENQVSVLQRELARRPRS